MSDRRPLASRDSKWAQRMAGWLAIHRVTPNHISQASVVFAALAGLCFWLSGGSVIPWLVLGALFVQARLLCNLFDGMVAIEGGLSASDGLFWNEAPDRYAEYTNLCRLLGSRGRRACPRVGRCVLFYSDGLYTRSRRRAGSAL